MNHSMEVPAWLLEILLKYSYLQIKLFPYNVYILILLIQSVDQCWKTTLFSLLQLFKYFQPRKLKTEMTGN